MRSDVLSLVLVAALLPAAGAAPPARLLVEGAPPTEAPPGAAAVVRGAPQEPGAEEIIAGSRAAFYGAGDDMYARVEMELIAADGRTRERELTMLRKDFDGGEQRYYIYFHRPPDVRRTTFMVHAYPGRNDDRWVYVPALDLVRRIAAQDARSSFVGSDFNYEDVSGRDVSADEHRLLRRDTLDGRAAWVIESRPVRAAEYERRVSWIDRETALPLREEYYDTGDVPYRVYTSDEIREVTTGDGVVPTVVARTMENVRTGHRTEVRLVEIEYDVGIADEVFTEASLRRPPRRWIR